jgi:peroxisomal membrane protein 4
MAVIFSRAPWRIRARQIFKATKHHALNLAKFVTIYKTLLLVQRSLNGSNGGKPRSLDTFFAGLVGGWYVFGERTPVNEQVRPIVSLGILLTLCRRWCCTWYRGSSCPSCPGNRSPSAQQGAAPGR